MKGLLALGLTPSDKGGDDEGGKNDEPPSMAFLSACDDAFDAVKADNKMKFGQAMASAVRIYCQEHDDEESGESDKEKKTEREKGDGSFGGYTDD